MTETVGRGDVPNGGRSAEILARVAAGLPDTVAAQLTRDWQRIDEAAAREQLELAPDESALEALLRVLVGSDYVVQTLSRRPALLAELLDSGDLARPRREGEYRQRVEQALAECADEATLGVALRRLRQREMVRIAWRDLNGSAPLDETLEELSALADACLDGALERLYAWQCGELGTPFGTLSGQPQHMVVLGMGKLGARELNYSSDIDLIFAFPEHGETAADNGSAVRPLANEQFFVRLGQRLIRAISETTADGFVFRVDMRLRPYGDSGPLVMGFDALEDYYQSQGREWERYAMIKARPVAGDPAAGRALMALLRPFVYRRYLDYGSFESLREMKAMINREVQRKGLQDNVKLGPGGIREIEFIGQAFQLIRAGREPALQIRPIKRVLRILAAQDYLPRYAVDGLLAAYDFLRRTENHLQAYGDEQTHTLPEEPLRRLRVALSLGFADWPALVAELERHRRVVREQFEQVITAPQAGSEGADEHHDGLIAVWSGLLEAQQANEQLATAGFRDPAEVLRRLATLRDSRAAQTMSSRGRARLDCLMPMLLRASSHTDDPDQTVIRLLDLIEAVLRRSAYLALLVENPVALSQLVRLCAASPWIARLLSRHPAQLDELLDPRTLYAPARREQLREELDDLLAGVDAEDLEQQMELLRLFRQGNALRVAAADIVAVMPLMVVSDHLTEIAEVIVERVLQIAMAQFAARSETPLRPERGFIVLGYGKLGGIELGYGSDLDLVFLHDDDSAQALYPRLAQRIIHMLNTRTPAGILYEVDVRLRPSGASGLLVSSLTAFAEYQRSEAWTWEHQALVRARPVAGDAGLAARFAAVREEILGQERDPARLRREVSEMRERMCRELSRGGKGSFDIKQDRGGMTDIEFLVQYAVLRYAHRHPGLLRWTDNIRLLEEMRVAGLIDAQQEQALATAYRDYRACGHRLTLQERPAVVDDSRFVPERELVQALWARFLEGSQE